MSRGREAAATAVRKARNALELQRRWLAYVASHSDKRRALEELVRWSSTSLPVVRRLTRPLIQDAPWFVFPALAYLEARVHPGMVAFEWGSGASSCYFARRLARIHSVEHDRGWAEQVCARQRRAGLENASVELIEPEWSAMCAPEFRSSSPDFAGACFERYARAIERFPDESFDLIVVDGRARHGCAQLARPKLRRGGLLVFDNSDRPQYAAALSLFDGWQALHFDGPAPMNLWPAFWRTSVFIRP